MAATFRFIDQRKRNHNDMYRDSRCGDRLSGAAPLWPLLAANSRLQRSTRPITVSGPATTSEWPLSYQLAHPAVDASFNSRGRSP
jgi:hypothetical protein